MHEKDIKRIVKEQLKKEASEMEISTDFEILAKKQKKQFAREGTDAVIAEYASYNQELDVPIESLIGIAEQQVDSKIIPLEDMADFVNNFHQKSGVIDFAKYRKPWPEIHNKELQFIDKLLDDRILNSLLSYEGYSPQMRDIFTLSVVPCRTYEGA